jgi:hypothetical protein
MIQSRPHNCFISIFTPGYPVVIESILSHAAAANPSFYPIADQESFFEAAAKMKGNKKGNDFH